MRTAKYWKGSACARVAHAVARQVSEWSGFDALAAALNRLAERARAAGDAAMAENAEGLRDDAAQLTPVEAGELRDAAAVRRVAEEEYEVGYWGLDYAVVQHERLDYEHPNGGQAKFLEGPFVENRERYVAQVADALRRALSAG